MQAAVSANTGAMAGLVKEWLLETRDNKRAGADGECGLVMNFSAFGSGSIVYAMSPIVSLVLYQDTRKLLVHLYELLVHFLERDCKRS